MVYEVERWPHTPVQRSIVFLNLLTTLRKYEYVMKKSGGSESTIIIGPLRIHPRPCPISGVRAKIIISRSKPRLESNAILNLVLLKDNK